MNNFDIGKRIKELRNRKGFSQEELADLTQLSLRTIQRIENGETDARGDSLKRLASALGITAEELTAQSSNSAGEINEDKNKYLMAINLSALSFLLFPMAGILVPLILWWSKKNTVKDIDVESKRLINFQISWFIFTTVVPIVILTMSFLHLFHFGAFLYLEELLMGVIGLYGFNILYIVFNAFRVYQNKRVIYQPAIPFIR